jgi:hypothetical protein
MSVVKRRFPKSLYYSIFFNTKIMTTPKKTIYQMLKSIAFMSFLIFIMASCHKETSNSFSNESSNLTLVHASPGTTAYDVKMNGRRLNLNSFTYGNYYNYGLVPSGPAVFSITRAGTNIVAAKDSFSLISYAAYSFYITDFPSNVSLLITKDDLSAPAAGKAKLRFINLNPDSGPLNLNYIGNTTPLFANIPFKSNTAFIQLNPATGIDFTIADSTGTNILATSAKYRIDQGRIYTIIAKGAKSATDTPTTAIGVINNR